MKSNLRMWWIKILIHLSIKLWWATSLQLKDKKIIIVVDYPKTSDETIKLVLWPKEVTYEVK